MPRNLNWLTHIARWAVLPVLLGALALGRASLQSAPDAGASLGLAVLGAMYLLYWRRPWPTGQRRAAATLAAMIPTLVLVQYLMPAPEAILWLYPATVAGSGLAPWPAAVVVGILALAAGGTAAPHTGPATVVRALETSHAILLAVALAGLGMAAVRQLVAANANLLAARAELAELAVARERERLARDLHDLLGRTLSLIAVKAELASRLITGREPAAEDEMREVQRLAREALRDVREVITGYRTPTVAAELDAAQHALRAAGIETSIAGPAEPIDPAQEAALAWAIREAVTNVIQHSGARRCRITLSVAAGATTLEVTDDGRGPAECAHGNGLHGLAERVRAAGGVLDVGPGADGGFRLHVVLRGAVPVVHEVKSRS